ncbi:MAG: glutathione transferase GstA [Burkholderiales bacterium]|jgi:glutathione S-transferase|nr:glutathione transferase GstA [Burkholderiales bacterium]
MKLYYSPGACSLAPHIALAEAGIPADIVRVDLRTHKLPDGSDYHKVNPKGYVPAVQLEDGTVLTEVSILLQYIADRKPGSLAPAFGNLERYKLMEWLNFVATEIHKTYGPLWHQPSDEVRASVIARLGKRYAIVEAQLAKHPFLAGSAFTIADAYLFTVTRWASMLKVDLSAFPHVAAYMKRIDERPAVKAAIAAEHGTK